MPKSLGIVALNDGGGVSYLDKSTYEKVPVLGASLVAQW